MKTMKLSNGIEIPMLGYGVYQVTPEECERCVSDAINAGYRHIDTAQAYNNEEGVGNAIKKSGIDRKDFFITTKVWVTNYGEGKTALSIDESLRKLGTDYIDLLLMHQPFGDYYGAWRDMEKAYKAGKVRSIGISNFYPDRFIDLYHFSNVKPMVNQIETHPFFQRNYDHKYMEKYNIAHESWGPFAEGRNNLFSNPTLKEIGEKYGKTVGQVVLRFLIQSDVIVFPKSVHVERIKENINVFDFNLTEEDMSVIRGLDTNTSSFFDHRTAESAEMFMKWF
jgi:Aldo/keto reductases, related to diketogulonate reductase